jgi:hypothetical protein
MAHSTENSCIFFLDNDPTLAAQSLFDADLKSSILYMAIVTSCAVKEMVGDVDLKKEGYAIYQHDIEPPFDYDVRWMESTPSIWKWCAEYFKAMLAEHEYRFEDKHPSHEIAHLFDSDGELEKGQVDEFVPPSISAISSKYHVDANFKTYKMYIEGKGASKAKYKTSVLNTNRNLYKIMYNDEYSGCDYTKREVPTFIRPPREEEGRPRVPTFGTGRRFTTGGFGNAVAGGLSR